MGLAEKSKCSLDYKDSHQTQYLFISVLPLTQIQTVTKKVEVVVEDVNATTVEGLVANITKEPQYIIKKSLQFKSGMNVLGM